MCKQVHRFLNKFGEGREARLNKSQNEKGSVNREAYTPFSLNLFFFEASSVRLTKKTSSTADQEEISDS